MGGAAAPIALNGSLYVAAGYGFGGQMPGNVLLAFDTETDTQSSDSRGANGPAGGAGRR